MQSINLIFFPLLKTFPAAEQMLKAYVCLKMLNSFILILNLQHAIRALALKVLREILRNQPARFKNYAELTIMKTLEAHKDPHKEVGNQLFYLFRSQQIITK